MAKKWIEVLQDPNFVELDENSKLTLAERYFNNVVLKDPNTVSLSEQQQQQLKDRLFATVKPAVMPIGAEPEPSSTGEQPQYQPARTDYSGLTEPRNIGALIGGIGTGLMATGVGVVPGAIAVGLGAGLSGMTAEGLKQGYQYATDSPNAPSTAEESLSRIRSGFIPDVEMYGGGELGGRYAVMGGKALAKPIARGALSLASKIEIPEALLTLAPKLSKVPEQAGFWLKKYFPTSTLDEVVSQLSIARQKALESGADVIEKGVESKVSSAVAKIDNLIDIAKQQSLLEKSDAGLMRHQIDTSPKVVEKSQQLKSSFGGKEILEKEAAQQAVVEQQKQNLLKSQLSPETAVRDKNVLAQDIGQTVESKLKRAEQLGTSQAQKMSAQISPTTNVNELGTQLDSRISNIQNQVTENINKLQTDIATKQLTEKRLAAEQFETGIDSVRQKASQLIPDIKNAEGIAIPKDLPTNPNIRQKEVITPLYDDLFNAVDSTGRKVDLSAAKKKVGFVPEDPAQKLRKAQKDALEFAQRSGQESAVRQQLGIGEGVSEAEADAIMEEGRIKRFSTDSIRRLVGLADQNPTFRESNALLARLGEIVNTSDNKTIVGQALQAKGEVEKAMKQVAEEVPGAMTKWENTKRIVNQGKLYDELIDLYYKKGTKGLVGDVEKRTLKGSFAETLFDKKKQLLDSGMDAETFQSLFDNAQKEVLNIQTVKSTKFQVPQTPEQALLDSPITKQIQKAAINNPKELPGIIFQSPESVRIAKQLLPPESWPQLQKQAYDDLISKSSKGGILNGRKLLDNFKQTDNATFNEIWGDQKQQMGDHIFRLAQRTEKLSGSPLMKKYSSLSKSLINNPNTAIDEIMGRQDLQLINDVNKSLSATDLEELRYRAIENILKPDATPKQIMDNANKIMDSTWNAMFPNNPNIKNNILELAKFAERVAPPTGVASPMNVFNLLEKYPIARAITRMIVHPASAVKTLATAGAEEMGVVGLEKHLAHIIANPDTASMLLKAMGTQKGKATKTTADVAVGTIVPYLLQAYNSEVQNRIDFDNKMQLSQ